MNQETAARKPIITLTDDDLKFARLRAAKQEGRYGRDAGSFSTGRNEDFHLKGILGEVAVLKLLRSLLANDDQSWACLCPIGSEHDLMFFVSGAAGYAHVKHGSYSSWPSSNMPFGVHAHQKLEGQPFPLVLTTSLKTDPRRVRIEGFITASELGQCRVIVKGEKFPGANYSSRTENRHTYFGQYKEISTPEILIPSSGSRTDRC